MRRLAGEGRKRVGHRWALGVPDGNALDGIPRLGFGFGDHHGDGIADMANPVDRKRPARRIGAGRAVLVDHLHAARERPVAGVAIPGAGQHREHAGRLRCGPDVERVEVRVGVRGAQHDGARLSRQVDILEKPSAAGQQAMVLLTPEGPTDGRCRHALGA